MSAHRRRTDLIADPAFAADPAQLDIGELRRRRRLCLDTERELSYQRRLLHGRLDLFDAERRRRGGPGETASDALPVALEDRDAAGPGRAAAATLATTPILRDGPGRRPVDAVLADDAVSRLGELTDDELDDARRRVAEMERELSAQRRTVHAAEAALAAELIERHRTGGVATDELIPG